MEIIFGRRFFSLVIVAVALVAATQTEALDLPCIADLANCGEFYNNTALVPTEACCGPLASALKNQVTCLCAVFNNPLLQKQLGINLQPSPELFNRCNITGAGPNICTSAAPASPPKNAPPTPGTPSTGAPFRSEWFGFATFFSFLLFIMA
ncbi:protease inhibitor/seed storage/lipid transfer protein family protein [Carex littledalei]|uniref:Protease inhibitor/seed storage/lipid transfer protein family protein n=1 Tax=Carex littledalei TaxID=544730 RepID=A0A833VKS0_9POAL|nr:protease inhibitor/seed storage/lipid transfer protein family protein [Carex littledalei]